MDSASSSPLSSVPLNLEVPSDINEWEAPPLSRAGIKRKSPFEDPEDEKPIRADVAGDDAQIAPKPTRSLPKRDRKAPARLDAEIVTPEKSKTPAKNGSRNTRGRANYDPDHVVSSEISVLVKYNVDLYKILCDDRAWSSLSREQQVKLVKLLPNAPNIDADGDVEIHNWPREALQQSTAFRTSLRIFKESLKEGRWDPEWRREAEDALKERADGTYDSWKHEEREEHWGQKMNGTNA